MTAEGLTVEPIGNVFSPNIRILPFVWPPGKERRITIDEAIFPFRDAPYGWTVVIKKGLKILSARHWYYWRWRFFFDIALFYSSSISG